MTTRIINGECLECESTYTVEYDEEMVSQEYPEHCPFCGTQVEELSEETDQDDDLLEDDPDKGWDF